MTPRDALSTARILIGAAQEALDDGKDEISLDSFGDDLHRAIAELRAALPEPPNGEEG